MRWFWIFAALTATVDLTSKHYAFAALMRTPWLNYDVIENWLSFTPHINTGALWGMGGNVPFALLLITALMIILVIAMAYSYREKNAPRWALGLVLGGAIGNFYDRLFVEEILYGKTLRGVRDFIYMRWEDVYSWPVYNIADVAIVIGVVVFLGWNIFSAKAKPADTSPETSG